MPPKKILLVHKLPEVTCISSVAVGESGIFWQSFTSMAGVVEQIAKEDPCLLFFDYRGVAGDPMAFIESVRDPQKKPPVFLVSDTLGMVSVIQAIRLGIKDYFQPPIDHRLIIERLQVFLKAGGHNPTGVQIEQWGEFITFLKAGDELAGEATPRPAAVVEPAARIATAAPVQVPSSTPPLPASKSTPPEVVKPNPVVIPKRVNVETTPANGATRPAVESPIEVKRLQAELEAVQEKYEAERLLLKQAQKKIEALQVAAVPVVAPTENELTRREQALAQQREVVDEKNRHVIVAKERLEDELMLLVQAKAKMDKEHAAWRTERDKTALEFAGREEALKRATVEVQKLTDGQQKLQAELEKLEAEQSLFTQAKTRQEKVRAEMELRFTERENGLVDRVLAQDAREKKQSVAEDQFLIEQEKLDSAQALLARERQTFDQEKVVTEAGFSRREQAVARLEAETKNIADAQKALAINLEKLAREREQLAHARAAIDRENVALAERVRQFEAKQHQFKEQMQQMLSTS